MRKEDFPLFESNHVMFLDNASTTQKPKIVIKNINAFYNYYNSNIHRGVYKMSQIATENYENVRKIISEFINSNPDEIIFTKGTTESINFLVYTIDSLLNWEAKKNGKNEIVLTEMEHHSNLVPWQQLTKSFGFKLKFIKVKDDFTLDLEDAKQKINENTAIVSLCHVSNSLGTINNVKEICKLAAKAGAISVVDAAQSISHMKVDVKEIGCDFLAFSGHKMYGPMGVGVLYGRKELLEKLRPFNFGGDMIESVTLNDSSWNTIPGRFEAGTQNVAGVIALGEAVKYIQEIGIHKIEGYEQELREYTINRLSEVKNVILYCPRHGSAIVSFNVKDMHAHDVASYLDLKDIAIRGGHHCNIPLMEKLGINGTARVSLAIYNSKSEIDKLIESLNELNSKNVMYKDFILDLYKNPMNFGSLVNATNRSHVYNPLCGDQIVIDLLVENNKIKDIKFKGQGCAISMASASLLTDKVKNMNVEEVKRLNKDDILKLLEIPISAGRLKCALLSLDGVKGALEKKQ